MKPFEEKTLEEILLTEDKASEEEYYAALSSLKASKIAQDIVDRYTGESIDFIWRKVMEEEQAYTSEIIFPGDLIRFYPNIKEQRAKTYITCDFSGGIIYPGSLYVNYRPLLDNISTGERYVLRRTIKVESGYYHELPTSISEFESLEQRMQLEIARDSTGIEYSHFSQRMGGELVLQKLKRRKKWWK